MLELPAARREMLVIARSPAFYRSRITSSIALLVLGIAFGIVYHYAGLRAIGPMVQMVTFILLTICLFVGVQLTSDSIAREKRDGTIGLLFLTHLTAFQIVIGKLIANGLTGFYWLLITVPLLSLMLIAGGLEGMQLTVLALSALNILFFSASVGLFVSARNVERKKAAARATWVVLFFWWGVPILVQMAVHYGLPSWLIDGLGLFAISGVYHSPFAGPRVRLVTSPWLNLLSIHLLAWAFVGLASNSLRRKWQDQPAAGARFSLRAWWTNVSLGKPAVRLRLRRKLLDRNPFLWLACRDRLRSLTVWIATFIIIGFVLYVAPFAGTGVSMIISFTVGLTIFHKAMMAVSSAHQLQVEQEQGTLEMLISTPLKVEEIIRGQLLASFRHFRGPAAVVLLMHAAIAAFILLGPTASTPNLLLAAGVTGGGVLYVFDLYAIAWTGMWGAVKVRDARNAAGFAMLRIVIIPALTLVWIMVAGSLINWYFSLGFNVPFPAVAALWCVLSISNNTAWILYIRRRLPAGLRAFALQRYSADETKSLLGVLGRLLGRSWGKISQKRAKQPPVIRSLPGSV